MKIQQSAEDYLEAMLVLQEKYGYIRSIDIAKYLGYKAERFLCRKASP